MYKILSHINVVIFDMDGLMIDSEMTRGKSFKNIIRKHGAVVNEEIPHLIGVRVLDNWKYMKKKYGLKPTAESLMSEGEEEYSKILTSEMPVAMPGLFELINFLKEKKYHLCVNSSSGMDHIKIKLSKLGIESELDCIVSGDSVSKGKPDPESYLTAARKMNEKLSSCLVLEDSPSGVEAAKGAGATCIAIPNKYTKDGDFSKADLVLESLSNVIELIS